MEPERDADTMLSDGAEKAAGRTENGGGQLSDESEPGADELCDMPTWLSDAWQMHQTHKLEAAEIHVALAKEPAAAAPSDDASHDAWRLMEEAAELRRALREKDAVVDELRAQLNPPPPPSPSSRDLEPGEKENRTYGENQGLASGDVAVSSHKLAARPSGAAELAAEAEASHEQASDELWGALRAPPLARPAAAAGGGLQGGGLQGGGLQGPRLQLQDEIEAHQVRGKLEGCRLELQAEARKRSRWWM